MRTGIDKLTNYLSLYPPYPPPTFLPSPPSLVLRRYCCFLFVYTIIWLLLEYLLTRYSTKTGYCNAEVGGRASTFGFRSITLV